MNPRTFLLCCLSTLLLLTSPAPAQEADTLAGTGSGSRVDVELIWQRSPLTPGADAMLGVVLNIAPRWHTQAGEGSPDYHPPYIATTVDLELPEGWSAGAIVWPEAKVFMLGTPPDIETTKGYGGRVLAAVPIHVPSDASGEVSFKATIGYQACDDRQCEMPQTVEIDATAAVGGGEASGAPTEYAELFTKTLANVAEAPPVQDTDEHTAVPGPIEYPEDQHVVAQVVTNPTAIAPGGSGLLGIVLNIRPHWHIQAPEGSPALMEDGIATTVEITVPEGVEAGEAQWPETVSFGKGEFKAGGFEGRELVVVPITVAETVGEGELEIALTLHYQACDDAGLCDFPMDLETVGTLTVSTDADVVASLPPDVAAMFEAFTGATTSAVAPTVSEQADEPTAASESATEAATGPTFFGFSVPRPDGAAGLLILALLSALGGFILNLTPCVLPVLPIKIMTISQHAGSPGRSLVLGLWMAAGVVAFWACLGLPVAFLSGVSDPSRIFGIWWVTLGIGVIIAAMGVGIMGLFTIQLPQSVYAVNPKADSLGGSFLFGVMTAVLGLPCFGFVAGALLAGAATLPPGTIMLIFASLGIGMAAPYLVLSAKPSLVNRIPRTGPASELVKQVMGLLLLAAAAYFVGSGLIALVSAKPYLAKQLHWWTIAIFACLAALWLILRTFQISRKTLPRVTFLVIGVLFGGVAMLYAMDSTNKARSDYVAKQEAIDAAGGAPYVTGIWNRYTPASFEQARDDGKITVLDFTAEWCLNCKFLKATVLNRDPVLSELNKDDVVKFMVDLTSTDDPGWDFLNELGYTGIPLLVVYTPGEDTHWESNAYTPRQVLDAIEDARVAGSQLARVEEPIAWANKRARSMEDLREPGKTVFAIFDAGWFGCNNPYLRMIDATVRDRLAQADVVPVRFDVTDTDSPAWGLIDELGYAGIPLMVLLDDTGQVIWESNAATPRQIIEAIDAASGRTHLARAAH